MTSVGCEVHEVFYPVASDIKAYSQFFLFTLINCFPAKLFQTLTEHDLAEPEGVFVSVGFLSLWLSVST